MAKAKLFEAAFYGIWDMPEGSDTIAASYVVHVYNVGGTVYQTVWKDADKAVAHSNGITLDANGQQTIYIDGAARIVIKDTNAATVFDQAEDSFQVDVFATLTISSALKLPNGTAGTPALSYTSDTTTGFSRVGSGVTRYSSAGTEKLRFGANGLLVSDGSAANPSISGITDATDGLYVIGAGNWGVAAGGSKIWEWDTTGLKMAGALHVSTGAGLTAGTTQTQAGGLALTNDYNNVTTVTNANDTVVLPAAIAGKEVTVENSGANNLRIYPISGDDLGEGADTFITIQPGISEVFKAKDGTTWKRTLSNGIGDFIRASTAAGHGSTNTKIRRMETTVASFGTAITQANSSTLGTTFTINIAGVYTIVYTDRDSAATNGMGLSVNSSQLTTAIASITNADILVVGQVAVVSKTAIVAYTGFFAATDVIRMHGDGTEDSTAAALTRFSIVKVA